MIESSPNTIPRNLELPIVKTCNRDPNIACKNCSDCGNESAIAATLDLESLLPAQGRVLSTLERDGSRRWLYPKLSKGLYWKRRRVVAYLLVAFFVMLPHFRWNQLPLVLLDIPLRRFIILGHTFLPTDTLLLAFGIIGIFLSVALVTSLSGRLWCGWGCPQTIYLEFFFRPIDRFFQGTLGVGGKPRESMLMKNQVGRAIVYLALSMFLAHTFLAYFVGTDRLALWLTTSPFKHPTGFLVMIGSTVALLYNFMVFREQMCFIACPYGRLQSVMLDSKSLIVGYAKQRGEPRGRLQKQAVLDLNGDCVDCKKCVATCPTGIDIRNGLQMECINCTQCIDACDEVMGKIGRAKGLIGYTSQDEIAGEKRTILRPRPVVYSVLLAVVAVAFISVLSTKYTFDARILRSGGNPFTFSEKGELRNSMKVRLVNRSSEVQSYEIRAILPSGVNVVVVDETKLTLGVGESSIVPILVEAPRELTQSIDSTPAKLVISDSSGNERELIYRILGPSH